MARRLVVLASLVLLGSVALAAEPEQGPPELAASLIRLSAAIDRLSAAMERQAMGGEDERAGQRVEVAVGILGLRMRKADRIEGEVRGVINEAEEMGSQIEMLKTQLAESDEQRRLEGREISPEDRVMREQMDRGLAMMESRIRSLETRRSALEAELDAQLRGLSRLEAILEDWLESQD